VGRNLNCVVPLLICVGLVCTGNKCVVPCSGQVCCSTGDKQGFMCDGSNKCQPIPRGNIDQPCLGEYAIKTCEVLLAPIYMERDLRV
jgi:hypothetical protein